MFKFLKNLFGKAKLEEPVHDGSFKVVLPAEDLSTADYFDIHTCSLARALKRKFPEKNIKVFGAHAEIGNEYFRIGNAMDILEAHQPSRKEDLTVYLKPMLKRNLTEDLN